MSHFRSILISFFTCLCLVISSDAYALGGSHATKDYERKWNPGVSALGAYFGGDKQIEITFGCYDPNATPDLNGVCVCNQGYVKDGDTCVTDSCLNFQPTECITKCETIGGKSVYTYAKTCNDGKWTCSKDDRHACENPCDYPENQDECKICTPQNGQPTYQPIPDSQMKTCGKTGNNVCVNGNCTNPCITWVSEEGKETACYTCQPVSGQQRRVADSTANGLSCGTNKVCFNGCIEDPCKSESRECQTCEFDATTGEANWSTDEDKEGEPCDGGMCGDGECIPCSSQHWEACLTESLCTTAGGVWDAETETCSEPECTKDADCDNDEICVTDDHVCGPACVIPVGQDVQCIEYTAADHTCTTERKDSGDCTTADDQPGTCQGGTCVDCPPDTQVVDGKCKCQDTDKEIINGTCVNVCENMQGLNPCEHWVTRDLACVSDGDANEGESCTNPSTGWQGTCQEGSCVTTCTTDTECPHGRCQDGQCTQGFTSCDTDEECKDDQVCITDDHVCGPACVIPVGLDTQCIEYTAANHTCTTEEKNSGDCTTADDQPGTCQGGTCVASACTANTRIACTDESSCASVDGHWVIHKRAEDVNAEETTTDLNNTQPQQSAQQTGYCMDEEDQCIDNVYSWSSDDNACILPMDIPICEAEQTRCVYITYTHTPVPSYAEQIIAATQSYRCAIDCSACEDNYSWKDDKCQKHNCPDGYTYDEATQNCVQDSPTCSADNLDACTQSECTDAGGYWVVHTILNEEGHVTDNVVLPPETQTGHCMPSEKQCISSEYIWSDEHQACVSNNTSACSSDNLDACMNETDCTEHNGHWVLYHSGCAWNTDYNGLGYGWTATTHYCVSEIGTCHKGDIWYDKDNQQYCHDPIVCPNEIDNHCEVYSIDSQTGQPKEEPDSAACVGKSCQAYCENDIHGTWNSRLRACVTQSTQECSAANVEACADETSCTAAEGKWVPYATGCHWIEEGIGNSWNCKNYTHYCVPAIGTCHEGDYWESQNQFCHDPVTCSTEGYYHCWFEKKVKKGVWEIYSERSGECVANDCQQDCTGVDETNRKGQWMAEHNACLTETITNECYGVSCSPCHSCDAETGSCVLDTTKTCGDGASCSDKGECTWADGKLHFDGGPYSPAPATDETPASECSKNEDCEANEFCNLLEFDEDEKTFRGECQDIAAKELSSSLGTFTVPSQMDESYYMTIPAAEAWCRAQGKNLISLIDLLIFTDNIVSAIVNDENNQCVNTDCPGVSSQLWAVLASLFGADSYTSEDGEVIPNFWVQDDIKDGNDYTWNYVFHTDPDSTQDNIISVGWQLGNSARPICK